MGAALTTTNAIIGGIAAVSASALPAIIGLRKINDLHVIINSRLTELLNEVRKSSYLAGDIAGRDAVRAEIANQALGKALSDAEQTNAGNTSKPVLPPRGLE